MSAKEFEQKSQETEMGFEVPRDEARYRERVEQLIFNQEKQLKANGVSFAERVGVDNPDFEDVEELEEIYTNLENEEIVENLKGLYGAYESRWGREGINNLLESFPRERFDSYSAKTSNGNLASLEILGEDLNKMDSYKKEEVVKSLSVLRNLWYSHYGFYDLRLVASYLEYGKKHELDTTDTVTKYIEQVSTKDSDVYYLVFGGKNKREKFQPKKVLGHIGLINGMEYPEDKAEQLYEPQKHFLHVDKLHLSEESLNQGKKIVQEVKTPIKLKNIREITRFTKSPFVPARRQVLVSCVLTGKMVRKFVELQEKDEMLIFADLDKDIASKNVSQMAIANSYTPEKFFISPEKQGLLMPRWLKDNSNVVKTGPTMPLFFTGRDVVENQINNGNEHDTLLFLEKIFNTVDSSSKMAKLNSFLDLVEQSITNQLNSIESSYVKVNKETNGSEISHTGQVGGPEGLIRVKDNKLAFEIAKNYYGTEPNFLPLPYVEEGLDFSNLEKEVLERVLYALEIQGLSPGKYNLKEGAQITPLGNRYVPMLKDIDSLEETEKIEEQSRQELLVQNLLARSKFFPIIMRFLQDNRESEGGVNFFDKVKSKYFGSTKLSLNEVKKLTSPDSLLKTQVELFSDTCFVCAGLGTGGMQLLQDLRKSIPVADYIMIDHGVVDSDNGHQMPTVNELGASKLAVAVDGMMKDVPVAPWGSKGNLLGGLVGFPTPYSPRINERLTKLMQESGRENVVFIDEIDVTDGKTILQKIEFHKLAIELAGNLGKPVSVSCGLDLGQGAIWRGNFIYGKDTKPFYGLLNFKPGVEEMADRVSPMILLAPLLIGSKLPAELELLLANMAKDGSLEGVGQTVYSSNQSSTHVGSSAILNSMMQSLGYDEKQMRKTINTTYVENPIKQMLSPDAYARYESYSGKEGFLLLPLLLHLSSKIYDTEFWPKDWKSLLDANVAYQINKLNTALEL